jgi:hypothetical protein
VSTISLLATISAAALAMMTVEAEAGTNVALFPAATLVSASSFLDFSSYSITLDAGGATTAQNNLLTPDPVAYTSNDESRYIFGANDSDETLVIDLGASYDLTSVGVTWFDAANSDRAPSSVSVSFSDTDGNFGSTVTAPSLPYGGGGDFIALASPVEAQYVEYSFGGDGGVAITELFANIGVPEPAPWALMIIGLGGIGAVLRSSRKTAFA